MYVVTLTAFPAAKHERLERVVQKHSGNKLDHLARHALLHAVATGQPQVVARYVEEHVAENAVNEFKLHGATVQLSTAQMSDDAAVKTETVSA